MIRNSLDKSAKHAGQCSMLQANGNESVINQGEAIPTGEVLAAIATALYELSEDIHDWESNVLTIKKTARPCFPWSSKIYSLREPIRR
jgi:hypothetical protein